MRPNLRMLLQNCVYLDTLLSWQFAMIAEDREKSNKTRQREWEKEIWKVPSYHAINIIYDALMAKAHNSANKKRSPLWHFLKPKDHCMSLNVFVFVSFDICMMCLLCVITVYIEKDGGVSV